MSKILVEMAGEIPWLLNTNTWANCPPEEEGVKPLNKGDRVVFKEYSGTKVKLDGVEYIVIDEKDVLACIE